MFIIKAEIRNKCGKGENRRLRNFNKIPAVIYDNKNGSNILISIKLDHDKLWVSQYKIDIFNMPIIINIDDKEEKVKIKSVQRHIFKPKFIHIDFIRI